MKLIKLMLLSFCMAVMVGCGSNSTTDESSGANGGANGSGFDSGVGTNGVGGGTINGLTPEEMEALRQITVFYFNYDSSDLQPDAMKALDVHAHDLMQNGRHIVLQGHTDERGTREYNMALGERRANAVKSYLTMQGVSPSQIEVVSYGKERPAVNGHDENAWSKNRRVELKFQ